MSDSEGEVEVPEDEQIAQSLEWIGFTENQAISIVDEGFDCFDDVMECSSNDISELALSFQKRTANEGRINFKLKRTKRIKALTQWTRDFRRTNNQLSLMDWMKPHSSNS